MFARPRTFALWLAALLLWSGCASSNTRQVIALDRFQRIFVVEQLNDNHQLASLLAAELRRLGRDATSGPRTMMPDNTDAVLTYTDRWTWDFRSYLIEFNLEVHTARTDKKLADARYYQPSLKTKSPEEIARELLTPLFAKPAPRS